MILLNTFSSEISSPISTKFHVNPTVETGLKVCSNGHTPLTVMPIYGKMMIIKKSSTFFFFKTKNCSNNAPFISCNDRTGKMLHDICISAVATSLRPSEWRPGGHGFNTEYPQSWLDSFMEIDREIFSMVILSLPLIQEGQLSVSGGGMCTILVNRLED